MRCSATSITDNTGDIVSISTLHTVERLNLSNFKLLASDGKLSSIPVNFKEYTNDSMQWDNSGGINQVTKSSTIWKFEIAVKYVTIIKSTYDKLIM